MTRQHNRSGRMRSAPGPAGRRPGRARRTSRHSSSGRSMSAASMTTATTASMKDGLDEMKRNIPGLKLIEAENVPETAEVRAHHGRHDPAGSQAHLRDQLRPSAIRFRPRQEASRRLLRARRRLDAGTKFRQFLRRDTGRLVSDGRGCRQNDEVEHARLRGRSADRLCNRQRQRVRNGRAFGQSQGADARGGDRRLVGQGQGSRCRECADRSRRRRRDHARRFAGYHHPDRRKPQRLFDRLPVDRGRGSLAPKYLDHRSRLHLGTVHDRDREERDCGHLQARDGAGGSRPRHDGDCSVRAGGAARCSHARHRLGRQESSQGFNPFTGPVTDNTGVVRIPAGQSWGGDKMGNFDWYVEGVIGKAK